MDKSSHVVPSRWSQEDIDDRRGYKCKLHHHNGLSHKKCYETENDVKERKCFLDIETTNLKADFGIILTWCLYDFQTGETYYDNITPEDIENDTADKRIVKTLVETLWQFDRIIGHYSTYFDVPFVRTRALVNDIEFPTHGNFFHTDTWKMARNLLCLHSNRQDSVAQTVQHKSVKTRINPDIWAKVLFGSKKQRTALIKEVLDHNMHDVEEGQGNYLKLLPYFHETKSYI